MNGNLVALQAMYEGGTVVAACGVILATTSSVIISIPAPANRRNATTGAPTPVLATMNPAAHDATLHNIIAVVAQDGNSVTVTGDAVAAVDLPVSVLVIFPSP